MRSSAHRASVCTIQSCSFGLRSSSSATKHGGYLSLVPKHAPPPTHATPQTPPTDPSSVTPGREMKLHTQMPLQTTPDSSAELLARIKIDRTSAEDPASSWSLSGWGAGRPGAGPGPAFPPQPSCMNMRRHVSLGCFGPAGDGGRVGLTSFSHLPRFGLVTAVWCRRTTSRELEEEEPGMMNGFLPLS